MPFYTNLRFNFFSFLRMSFDLCEIFCRRISMDCIWQMASPLIFASYS